MGFFYSKHAEERCSQRKISKKAVKKTVFKPDKVLPGNSRKEKKYVRKLESGEHPVTNTSSGAKAVYVIVVVVSLTGFVVMPYISPWILFGGGATIVTTYITSKI